MQRSTGIIAITVGWLSILLGAVAGILASQYFGLTGDEAALPGVNVYGVNSGWIFIAYLVAAVLAAVVLRVWVLTPDPRPNLRLLAIGMAIAGIVLLPDSLGRAFGLPLFAGAAAIWIGAELLSRDVATSESGAGGPLGDETAAISPGPTSTPAASPAAAQPAGPVSSAMWDASAAAPAQPQPPLPSPPPQPPVDAPAARPRRTASRKRPEPVARICPWCSSPVPAEAASCPNCLAALDTNSADAKPIPGLTVVSPELQRYAAQAGIKKRRQSLLTILFSDESVPTSQNVPPASDASALQPPTQELRAEMARLDAEIAARAATPDDKAAQAVTDNPAPGASPPVEGPDPSAAQGPDA